MLVAALLSVAAAALGAVSATDGSCKLNLQTQLNPHNEPLILEVNETRDKRLMLDIIRPQVENISDKKKQGVIHVVEGKKLLIACPSYASGSTNNVTATGKQTGFAICSNGILTINSLPATEENLSCSDGVAKSWIKKTNETCGKGDNVGTKFVLGFRLNDDGYETFFPMVEVCHNIDEMVTYYTSHQLYGASLDGAVKSSERRSFSPGPRAMGLYAGVSADAAYSKIGQKAALDDILGEGAGDKYVNSKVFLARGHLSPDADFIYNSGQQMTYYYVNAAPQWQTFNAFNWLAVENTVRKLAAKEEATLNVWTGTYGILKLKDSKGNEKEIYLDPKESTKSKKPKEYKKPKESKKPKEPKKSREPKLPEESDKPRESHFPVPEVYWKLVQHPTKRSCTIAVGHNNVFLEDPPTPICEPKDVYGWPSLPRLEKGYVYYCDYESFKKTVSYVPEIECTDLFKFSHSH